MFCTVVTVHSWADDERASGGPFVRIVRFVLSASETRDPTRLYTPSPMAPSSSTAHVSTPLPSADRARAAGGAGRSLAARSAHLECSGRPMPARPILHMVARPVIGTVR